MSALRKLLLLAAFALGASSSVDAVQRTQFDHLTTGYELRGFHRDLSCEFCHLNGVFKGTPRNCSGCHTSGSRVNATPRPLTHVSTEDQCELCHSLYAFQPIVHMDHSAVRGTCFSCHNGVFAKGKTPDHIPSNNDCDGCHTTIAFNPVRVDHSALVAKASQCRGCHAGISAASMPRGHIPTQAQCSDCHSTLAWIPARLDHAGLTSACQSCHNGGSATGKSVSHMATTRDCAVCHRYPVWANPTFAHVSAQFPGEHHGSPACSACHVTNTEQAAWPFAAYRPGCGGCHANLFKPEQHARTSNGLKYSISELRDCSGSCHLYTDARMTTVAKARPAGHHKVTDSAFH